MLSLRWQETIRKITPDIKMHISARKELSQNEFELSAHFINNSESLILFINKAGGFKLNYPLSVSKNFECMLFFNSKYDDKPLNVKKGEGKSLKLLLRTRINNGVGDNKECYIPHSSYGSVFFNIDALYRIGNKIYTRKLKVVLTNYIPEIRTDSNNI